MKIKERVAWPAKLAIVLRRYKQQNPDTEIGEPGNLQGLNTGVVLYNLQRMRDNEKYNHYVDNASGLLDKLTKKFFYRSHLGDQCFFSLLSFEHPEWFHILPCSYNFQLDTSLAVQLAFRDIFNKYHNCTDIATSDDIKIYHGNGGTTIPDDWK